MSLVSGRSGVAASRIAATGAIREARSAGSSAAITVTLMPTAYDAMIAAGRHAEAGESQAAAADVREHVGQQRADADAGAEPDGRGDHADHDRLDQHRADHLLAAAADRPQQREFLACAGPR